MKNTRLGLGGPYSGETSPPDQVAHSLHPGSFKALINDQLEPHEISLQYADMAQEACIRDSFSTPDLKRYFFVYIQLQYLFDTFMVSWHIGQHS